jgi:hypothetical protein
MHALNHYIMLDHNQSGKRLVVAQLLNGIRSALLNSQDAADKPCGFI